MLFSILVPAYNVEQYIENSLQSVLKQGIDNYEVIIIDDGSTDSTPAICDKYKELYPNKFTIIHKHNEGLLLARRDAINIAKGEYFVFLDSDDELAENALVRYKECIEANHPDFIVTDVYTWHVADERLEKWHDISFLPHAPASGELCMDISILKHALLAQSYCCWSMWQKCVRSDIVKTDFDFRKYKGLQHGEDTLQTLFIFNNAKNFVYLDGCFYKYRIGSGMTASIRFKQVEDFYNVSEVMRKECRSWAENIDDFIDVYVEMAAMGYLMDLSSMSKLSRKEFYDRFNQLINYRNNRIYLTRADFHRKDTNASINKMRRYCNHLLVTRQYEILYLMMLAHKVTKKKWYKDKQK